MNKKVIILKGAPKTGKTRTIKYFLEVINKSFQNAEIEIIERMQNKEKDICKIVKIDNKLVGILSLGDPPVGRIKKLINILIGKECNYIVCAMRTKGQTMEIMDILEENDFVIITICKQRKNTDDEINKDILNNVKKIFTEIGIM